MVIMQKLPLTNGLFELGIWNFACR